MLVGKREAEKLLEHLSRDMNGNRKEANWQVLDHLHQFSFTLKAPSFFRKLANSVGLHSPSSVEISKSALSTE